MSNRNYYIIFSVVCVLSLYSNNYVQAQENITSFNLIQKDAVLKDDLELSKNQLCQTLMQNLYNLEIDQHIDNAFYNLGTAISVGLLSNGFRFTCPNSKIAEIHFADITDYKFKIIAIENNIQSSVGVTEYKLEIGNTILSVKSDRQYILKIITKQFINLQKLWNDLFFKINLFEQAAMLSNSIQAKPNLTEEQRRCIIQAEAFTKLYNYKKAIDLNYQLIAIHPTAYPNVYLNIAILLAETNRLNSAIYNMKKFLLLNPSTEDAQFAKRKIEEWEIIMNN